MTDYPRLSTLKTGLACRCPRCGKGPLFKGYLTLQTECPACGLSYAFADPADGPAFFVMLVIGLLVTGLALYVEVAYAPPFWVHFLLWIPLIAIITLPLLRLAKSLMVGMQYRHKAAEGRIDRADDA